MGHVRLANVSKIYPASARHGEFTAIRDLDLAIEPGEFMVLVGPSGCGKSTLLRMIAGLEAISGGTIAINNRVVNGVPPKDRGIAMVFQNYALYPHMTVFENMAFGLKLAKTPRAEIDRRVREAADILGLQTLLDRRPAALSGGQRQRVAVGRAIVRQPQVFLFDEPLSNLDAKMRVQMRTEIAKLHARLGATMIYVTHDQTEAMTMGDRICVLRDGRIEQLADPLTLYRAPANLFVAGFIGSPAMNFLRGTLQRDNDVRTFVSADGAARLALPALSVTAHDGNNAHDVVLGIRPEHLTDEPRANSQPLAAIVELAEPTGAETFLHVRVGATTLIARVAAASHYATGDRVTLHLDTSHAHLFDAQREHVLR